MPSDAREVLVDLAKTRSPEQLEEYERIQEAGICPFCPEHRSEYAEGVEVSTGEDWWLFENNWPYKNTRRHVMAVTQQHGTYLEDFDPSIGSDLFSQLRELEASDGYTLASLNARFGFVLWTGASVAHLHAHLMVPEDPSGDTFVEEYSFGELIASGDYWDVFSAADADPLAREHLLIATKEKATYLRDVPADADEELFSLMQAVEEQFEFTHGGLHARFGDRAQRGDAIGRIVIEMIAPLDEIANDPERKLRKRISEEPPVQFKIST